MREETRDFLARELLIVAALAVASLLVTLVLVYLAQASEVGLSVDALSLLGFFVFVRWVVWAARRAATRPEQHPHARRALGFTVLGLVLLDALLFVHGFLNGGPTPLHLVLALSLGTTAAFLFHWTGLHFPRPRRLRPRAQRA